MNEQNSNRRLPLRRAEEAATKAKKEATADRGRTTARCLMCGRKTVRHFGVGVGGWTLSGFLRDYFVANWRDPPSLPAPSKDTQRQTESYNHFYPVI